MLFKEIICQLDNSLFKVVTVDFSFGNFLQSSLFLILSVTSGSSETRMQTSLQQEGGRET